MSFINRKEVEQSKSGKRCGQQGRLWPDHV